MQVTYTLDFTMVFPTATRKTAFIAGASLVALIFSLTALQKAGVFPDGVGEKELAPLIIIFFFVSVFLFVIDVRSVSPEELKTKIPLVYFPTDRKGLRFIFAVWGRMLIWFLGAATAAVPMAIFDALFK